MGSVKTIYLFLRRIPLTNKGKKRIKFAREYVQVKLRREDIENGRFEEVIRAGEAAGLFKRLPDKVREQSRRNIMEKLPKGEDAWLFAYGSLIWCPMIVFSEQRLATLYGFHRRFCLSTKIGRGTPEQPGLLLGLESGGSCHGVAFRIASKDVDRELKLIWNREMVAGSYTPRLVKLKTEHGPVQAVTFVINREHENYAGRLSSETVADIIAKAGGPLGNCADYLFSTEEHMRELDLHDRQMFHLCDMVRERLARI